VQDAVAFARHVGAEHLGDSLRRQDETHDHRDRRGLACAVAAEQPDDRAARDGKANAVDGGDLAVALGEVGDGNGRGFGAHGTSI
jgi:hypothetical protein